MSTTQISLNISSALRKCIVSSETYIDHDGGKVTKDKLKDITDDLFENGKFLEKLKRALRKDPIYRKTILELMVEEDSSDDESDGEIKLETLEKIATKEMQKKRPDAYDEIRYYTAYIPNYFTLMDLEMDEDGIVTGKTYHFKDLIKLVGKGKWNAGRKGWFITKRDEYESYRHKVSYRVIDENKVEIQYNFHTNVALTKLGIRTQKGKPTVITKTQFDEYFEE